MPERSPQDTADARRLVLGAAVGMPVDDVRVFIESLRGSGYAGPVVMFVAPLDFALAAYLRRHGVIVRRAFHLRRLHGPIHAYRFELFARYLRQHVAAYDQVLIADVRDVAFQAHPFTAIDGDGCHFFLEGARTIGEEPTNLAYARMFLAPAQAEALAPHRISCCGVTLGGAPAVVAYLDRMAAHLRAVPRGRTRRYVGADTAFHNLMLYVTREVAGTIVDNNQHVATMGIEPATRYRVGSDGSVRTADGRLPAILHQYDRIPAIRAAVDARWA